MILQHQIYYIDRFHSTKKELINELLRKLRRELSLCSRMDKGRVADPFGVAAVHPQVAVDFFPCNMVKY